MGLGLGLGYEVRVRIVHLVAEKTQSIIHLTFIGMLLDSFENNAWNV